MKSVEQYLISWQTRNGQRLDEYIDLEGVRVFVPRNIFSPDPTLTNSTRQLIRALPDRLDGSALDMGTGSGILAIHLAMRGANVVATDSDLATLAVGQENSLANGFAERIRFIQSDLFDSVEGCYSLVVANLPIVDSAWQGLSRNVETQMRKFFSQLPDFLLPNGRCLLAFASFGDEAMLSRLLEDQALPWCRNDENRFGVTWSIYEIYRR